VSGNAGTQVGTSHGTSVPLICVVLGATASGKSALALDIAQRTGGEIVSMDALKVYRGMDIGTAKPSTAERRGIPHHMIDLVEPAAEFNVALYLRAVEPAITDVLARGKLPVIDCGTPLYLKAFMSGMVEGPEPDTDLRARLHINDRKRVIRALEYAIQTGEPLSPRQTQFAASRPGHRYLLTGPLWPQEKLHDRISRRVDHMLERGFAAEVSRILGAGGFSRTSGEAIGYHELVEHHAGRKSLPDAIEETKRRTRQLARKQLRWFKRFEGVRWLLTEDESELARAAVFLAEELSRAR
jgi:tRNA dimethylallyltransferase